MHYYPEGDIINALWFHELRLFLDKESGFKVLNLYIDATNCANFIELEDLNAIGLQPYELEHLELQLDTTEESSDNEAFVDALLWCCRPQSLTISVSDGDFEVQSDFVQFTYEKLLEQQDEGHTSIQIVSPSPRPLMSLLPTGETITFIKEKETG
ncbi:hypothetical protein L1987_74704 [Smallanthus sonchifolius]|uniref:Uncharacterized protein n=1 Tax=Smallanthus sonchifolius TaxID=185202 RepID=A0ACB9A3U1_9ASTR|nr:hypothetical protein L1987_74704 [Smallanthus sonchifolius]